MPKGPSGHSAAVCKTDRTKGNLLVTAVASASAAKEFCKLQTSEFSARGLCENCSVFLGEVWSDFWAALLQLGDVAITVKWYSSLPYAKQYSDPAASDLS